MSDTFVVPTTESASSDESSLATDERWLLVLRILSSRGFLKAEQLRKILVYITRGAILTPEKALSEYEIAREVLQRKADFDPADDNIVRSQMSHLRRKLEVYYAEFPTETLYMSIPKGGYLPRFEQISFKPVEVATSSTADFNESALLITQEKVLHPADSGSSRNRWLMAVLVTGIASFLIGGYVPQWLHMRFAPSPRVEHQNEFVGFLGHETEKVSIVLPDTSLMMVQNTMNADVSPSEYETSDRLQKEVDAVNNSDLRQLLHYIWLRRNTSEGEALIANDFERELSSAHISCELRYARDLHSQDFSAGNFILIGSRRSNPWTMLFTPRTNFQFVKNPNNQLYLFRNTHPHSGEMESYVPYQDQGDKLTSYVDVALTANLTNSGYVLLINGSDAAANEAASRFLLHGKLPPEITEILQHKDLSTFEFLLRGTHAGLGAEVTFDLVATRFSKLAP